MPAAEPRHAARTNRRPVQSSPVKGRCGLCAVTGNTREREGARPRRRRFESEATTRDGYCEAGSKASTCNQARSGQRVRGTVAPGWCSPAATRQATPATTGEGGTLLFFRLPERGGGATKRKGGGGRWPASFWQEPEPAKKGTRGRGQGGRRVRRWPGQAKYLCRLALVHALRLRGDGTEHPAGSVVRTAHSFPGSCLGVPPLLSAVRART